LSEALQNLNGVACPGHVIDLTPFSFPECNPTVLNLIDFGYFSISELQCHFLIFSLFASIIGPFGGFFASGLKRSIKIKVLL